MYLPVITQTDLLTNDPAQLKQIIDQQTDVITENQTENKQLTCEKELWEEKYKALQNRLFGSKSEKLQKRTLNRDSFLMKQNWNSRKIKQICLRSKKPLKLNRLPVENVAVNLLILTFPVKQLIGEEITEDIKIIPKRIIVQKHVQKKYGPCGCEESQKNETEKIITCAGRPKKMIPGSITTASLLAYILTAKFVDHLPYYRQEKQFERIGIEIARKSMCDWQIHVSRKCQKLFEIMEKEIRCGPLINMDETTCKVLNEPDRPAQTKSYMWVLVGGSKGSPIILYYYSPTRKGEIAKNLLDDYQGYLQTDGYKAYERAIQGCEIIHVGCWVHARLYFHEAVKVSKKTISAQEGLKRINDIYRIDNQLKAMKLAVKEYTKLRMKEIDPEFKNFMSGY